jgi:hypothetical protein
MTIFPGAQANPVGSPPSNSQLGIGSPSESTFLRGDRAWVVPPAGMVSAGRFNATGGETKMEVTGLDLDTEETYFLRFVANFQGSLVSTTFFWLLNDDTNQTGYAKEAPNGLAYAVSANDSRIDFANLSEGNARSGHGYLLSGFFSPEEGGDKLPGLSYFCYGATLGTCAVIYKGFGSTNIEKISLNLTGQTFGTGSFLEVFKLG